MPKAIPSNGRELAEDLANERRLMGYLAFTEIELPGTEYRPLNVNGDYEYDYSASKGRVDLVALKPHQYINLNLVVYEVKTSKSDFRTDDGSQKWRRYFNVCHRLYFAAPKGILERRDVPDEAGLVVRSENGWSVVKAAPNHTPQNLSMYTILALLYQGKRQDSDIRRLRDRIIAKDNITILSQAKHIGRDIAERLSQKSTITKKEDHLQTIIGVIRESFGIDIDSNALYKPDEKVIQIIQNIGMLSKYCETVEQIGEFLESLGSVWKYDDLPECLSKTKLMIENLSLPEKKMRGALY